MLLDLIIGYNLVLIIGCAILFALIGLIFRTGPSGKIDRDNLVYADGLQGLTVATLFVVAIMVIYRGSKSGKCASRAGSNFKHICSFGSHPGD